jgi:hypothetical protein
LPRSAPGFWLRLPLHREAGPLWGPAGGVFPSPRNRERDDFSPSESVPPTLPRRSCVLASAFDKVPPSPPKSIQSLENKTPKSKTSPNPGLGSIQSLPNKWVKSKFYGEKDPLEGPATRTRASMLLLSILSGLSREFTSCLSFAVRRSRIPPTVARQRSLRL